MFLHFDDTKKLTKWFIYILNVLTMFCTTAMHNRTSKCLQHLLMIDDLVRLVSCI